MSKVSHKIRENIKSNTISYSDIVTQEVLTHGFNIYIKGRGSSMYPFVRTGDKLLVEPRKINELHIGDIVFWRRAEGVHVAHRLVKKINSNTILTKGDNLDYYDVPVSEDMILGRILSIERNDRIICLDTWFNKFIGRCCGIASPMSRWLRLIIKPGWKLYRKFFQAGL